MRKLSAVAAIATCLALSAPALAAPLLPGGAPLATTKSEQVELVTLAAKIQDDRATELEDIAAYATKTAKELEAHAEIRDKSAGNFEERAKKFSDAASSVQDATVKKELGAFAKEMETFAKHDRDFAKERRRASKVFFEEAERAQKWAKGHRDTAARLRGIAEKLKKLARSAALKVCPRSRPRSWAIPGHISRAES